MSQRFLEIASKQGRNGLSHFSRYEGEVYGFDGSKRVKGRKRHGLVDAQGLMIGLLVTEATAPEGLVADFLVNEYKQRLTHLRVIWVDQVYSGPKFVHAIQQLLGNRCK